MAAIAHGRQGAILVVILANPAIELGAVEQVEKSGEFIELLTQLRDDVTGTEQTFLATARRQCQGSSITALLLGNET
jgi:hypothetical protein